MARVLIVVDDAAELDRTRATFERAGHEVLSTQDPLGVFPLLDATPPDAIVLDTLMPEAYGRDLRRRLSRLAGTRDVPVVELSMPDGGTSGFSILGGSRQRSNGGGSPDPLVAQVEVLLGLSRQFEDLGGLEGALRESPFLDLAESLQRSGRSGLLEVRSRSGSGCVVFRGHRPVSAAFGRLRGSEAILSMIELRDGGFRFRPMEAGGGPEAGNEELCLEVLGLKAAWTQDELERRAHLLPRPDERLETTVPSPPEPAPWGELPRREVVRHLQRFPGSSLVEVVRQEIAAPNRVRLAVAGLVEEGMVRAAQRPRRGEPRLPPRLDAAVRELLQVAVFRGLPLTGVGITVRVAPDGWQGLKPLLAKVPAPLLGPEGSADRKRLFEQRQGGLRLAHEAGCLSFDFATPEGGGEPPDHRGWLVLWLGDATPAGWLAAQAEAAGRTDPRAAVLVAAASDAAAAGVGEELRRRPGWRVASGAIRALDELLRELVAADGGAEAAADGR